MTAPKPPAKAKKKTDYKQGWAEARTLMWTHRRTLAIGFVLMLLSRAAGFVGPASTKWLMDEVVGKKRFDLLWPLALAVGGAALVQAATSFGLSQVSAPSRSCGARCTRGSCGCRCRSLTTRRAAC
jgi:subfamily B ATP-binding cassette protein MsbA